MSNEETIMPGVEVPAGAEVPGQNLNQGNETPAVVDPGDGEGTLAPPIEEAPQPEAPVPTEEPVAPPAPAIDPMKPVDRG